MVPHKYKGEILVVLLILTLFVVAGYFSQVYLDQLTALLEGNMVTGMVAYVLGATITTVIAPLSFLPVLPVAVSLWGSFVAAMLSIVAWSFGSAIAFLLARRYGRPLVLRLVGERKMKHFTEFMPQRNLFIAVVFLRIALPVDLLSYALGLIGVMRFWPYMLATVIGLIPFAFSLSYLAGLDTRYQIGAFIIAIVVIVLTFPRMKRQYKRSFQNEAEKVQP